MDANSAPDVDIVSGINSGFFTGLCGTSLDATATRAPAPMSPAGRVAGVPTGERRQRQELGYRRCPAADLNVSVKPRRRWPGRRRQEAAGDNWRLGSTAR